MQIGVDVTGLEKLRDEIKDFSERRLKAAIATALTRTAVQVRAQIDARMRIDLDNPTPYTRRQLRYIPAKADKLVAAVGFDIEAIMDQQGKVIRYQDAGPGRTPAGKYMRFQVGGGQRTQKRFEKALETVGVLPKGWRTVPGQRAKMDAYGNQSVGELRQILSYFDAAELVAGSRQNSYYAGRQKKLKGTRKTAGFEYFVAGPTTQRTFVRSDGRLGKHKMQPGIYRRTITAFGSRVEPIVIFVQRAIYGRRFDFEAIGMAERDRVFPGELRRALSESAKRLAAR